MLAGAGRTKEWINRLRRHARCEQAKIKPLDLGQIKPSLT